MNSNILVFLSFPRSFDLEQKSSSLVERLAKPGHHVSLHLLLMRKATKPRADRNSSQQLATIDLGSKTLISSTAASTVSSSFHVLCLHLCVTSLFCLRRAQTLIQTGFQSQASEIWKNFPSPGSSVLGLIGKWLSPCGIGAIA